MSSILLEADLIVNGSRKSDYGYTESFTKIAQIASLVANKEFTPQDVCKILLAVKLVRESYRHKRDNLVDLAGYAELLNSLEDGLDLDKTIS